MQRYDAPLPLMHGGPFKGHEALARNYVFGNPQMIVRRLAAPGAFLALSTLAMAHTREMPLPGRHY